MSTFPVLLSPSSARFSGKPSRKFSVSWLPALCGVVFVACTSTAYMGGTHSGEILASIWQSVLGHWHYSAVWQVNLIARKVGHFTGHGLLSLVFRNTWYTVLRRTAPERRGRWLVGSAFLAVLTTMAIASMDELHQTFVPGRVGCVRDVMIDTAGALFVNALFVVWMKTRQRRRGSFSQRRAVRAYSSI